MRVNAAMLQQSLQCDLSRHIDVNLPSWSVDDSPLQVACYRLKESLLKKFNQEDEPSNTACSAALVKFLAVNKRVGEWTLNLDNVQPDWELLGELKRELKEFLDPSNEGPIFSDYTLMFHKGYAGPGASISALGTDFYAKMFGSELSSTESLSDVWRTLVRRDPVFSQVYKMPKSGELGLKVVGHSNLSFVNKNQDVARTICTEPSVNMWMQLGMGSILHSRLREKYGIDFSVQPDVNRRLARLGSLLDHVSTIDLESASDSMGMSMLREVLPRSFMAMLSKLRTPSCRLPDGSLVPLEMVSTMGNGFTFPLQTLLFAASCVAVYRYLGIPCISKGPWSLRNMSVFGDDIIIDSRATRLLLKLLGILGFVVNSNKTFVEGPFRESCGHDRFLGHDVRPVYIKQLVTLQDSFVAINKLNEWSAKTGVSLRHTVSYVLACFPRARNCPIPLEEADDAGVRTPARYIDRCKRSVRGAFGLLRYVKSTPKFHGYSIDTDACRLVGSISSRVAWNPEGLLVAFLGGYVRGYRVSVRQPKTRYITKRCVTPSWDYILPQILPGLHGRYERLVAAYDSNIESGPEGGMG